MGMAELQGVVQALSNAHQRKIQNAQLQAVAQMNQAKQEAEEKQREIELQRLADEHEYHQELLKGAQQTRKLNYVKEKQNLQNDIETKQSLPTGAQFLNGGSFEKGGQIQLPSEFNDPDSGAPAITAIDPSNVIAKRQADYKKILMQPIVDENTRKEQQAAADRMEQLKLVQEEASKRAEAHNDTMAQIAAGNQQTRAILAAMAAKNNSGPEVDDATIADQVHGLLSGTYTREQIKKLYTGKLAPVGVSIINQAAKLGVPFTDAQKKQLDDLKARVENIPLMDKAVDNLPDTHNKISAFVEQLGPRNNNDFTSATDQLKSNLARDTKSTSGLNRLAVPELDLNSSAFIPTPATNKDLAIKNRDAYYGKLKKTTENLIQGATPEQINLIQHEVGIHNYFPYKDQKALSNANSAIMNAVQPNVGTQPPTAQ